MAISNIIRERLLSVFKTPETRDIVCDAIDQGANPAAAAVVVIPAQSALVGVDGTGNNAAPLAAVETRLLTNEAKLNELITKLKAAGIVL